MPDSPFIVSEVFQSKNEEERKRMFQEKMARYLRDAAARAAGPAEAPPA